MTLRSILNYKPEQRARLRDSWPLCDRIHTPPSHMLLKSPQQLSPSTICERGSLSPPSLQYLAGNDCASGICFMSLYMDCCTSLHRPVGVGSLFVWSESYNYLQTCSNNNMICTLRGVHRRCFHTRRNRPLVLTEIHRCDRVGQQSQDSWHQDKKLLLP